VVEAGHGQSGDIQGLMVTAGLVREKPPKADLAGVRRAVAGRKLPS
jgi:release factor glutamine methyltransferase